MVDPRDFGEALLPCLKTNFVSGGGFHCKQNDRDVPQGQEDYSLVRSRSPQITRWKVSMLVVPPRHLAATRCSEHTILAEDRRHVKKYSTAGCE